MNLYINETELKKISPLAKYVNVEEIKHTFLFSQRVYITGKFGEALCEDLYAKATAKPSALSEKEAAAWDLLQRSLALYISAEAIPFLTYKFSAEGVVQYQDNNVSSLNARDVELMGNKLHNQAEQYRYMLVEYLEANAADFPLYASTKCAGKSDNFFSGIQFDY